MASNMMFAFLFLSLGSCLAFPTDDEAKYLALENPDLVGGDMLGVDPNDRNAVIVESMLWPNGIIPYELAPGLINVFPQNLRDAFDQYEKNTCIKFVERTNEVDYVRIFNGKGCYSMVGHIGGMQLLSLGRGCGWTAFIVHELGHAVGFYHEQNRSDRDQYIKIFWENLIQGSEDQFFLLKPNQNQLLTPFDYMSVMMYGSMTFSKDRKAGLRSMELLDGTVIPEVFSAEKGKLNANDIKRINMLYKCKK